MFKINLCLHIASTEVCFRSRLELSSISWVYPALPNAVELHVAHCMACLGEV